MANLKETEKLELEKFFKMSGGYVLDFTNKSFRQFVSNTIKIDIENTKYATNGNSKANRLKTLWQIESDDKVGLLTKEMLDYWKKKKNLKMKKLATIKIPSSKIVLSLQINF